MAETPHERAIGRILVALNASPHSLAMLEAAARLAAELEAELMGLFVEDINLLRLAGLPFAREVADISAVARQLDVHAMERALRGQAEQIRRALAQVSERRSLRWSFRAVRGNVVAEVVDVAREADLIIVGREARWTSAGGLTASTAYAVTARAPCSVVLLRHGASFGRPVVVWFDGSAAAQRALATAAQLARADDKNLVVMVPAATADKAAQLEETAAAWLSVRGLRARFRRLARGDATSLAQTVRREGGRVLVLDAASPFLQDPAVHEALNAVDCPLVVVR